MNIVALAKHFNLNADTIRNHSASENWNALRKKTVSEAEVKLIDNVSDKLAETNLKHAATYKQAQAYITRRLSLAIAKAQSLESKATEHIQIGQTTIPIIDDSKLMSPQQIKFLMEGLKVAVDGERVALGLPTSVTKSENDINLINPFAEYRDDQLKRIIEITDAELKSSSTPEAELPS